MTISPPGLRPSATEETTLLDRRRRKRRRRVILRITIGLLVLAMIIAGIWLVGFSSVLAVQQTRISGTSTLTEDQVAEIAAVPIGAPMARVNIDAVQQRVAKVRRVESVQVDRRWPDTVRIRIVERSAVYAIPQGAEAVLVDRFGVGYRTVPTSEASRYPKAVIGTGDQALYEPLAEVVSALPRDLREQLVRIEADTRDSIQLRLEGGRTVFWGSETQSELKAKVTAVLLKQDGTHFDVSAPGSPAVR